MGFDFTVTFSGVSAQTVAGGLIASYMLVITPLAGSAGSFTFACDSLPANALCTFNPNGESLTAGATGNVTVQVSTGSTTAFHRGQRPSAWGLLPLLCGLLLMPLGGRRGRKDFRVLLLLIALASVAGTVSSCAKSGGGTGGGGGGGGTGGAGGAPTPPGTYSIPVAVTSTTPTVVSHSVTLTLTVD
jgi:uncharacterized membrane protein YgcG